MSDGFFGQTPPKTSFIFGFIAGIAISAVVGLLFAAGGGISAGSGNTVKSGDVVATAPAPSPAPSARPPVQQAPIDVPVTKDDHVRGNPKAEITIVEFSDLQCPYCRQFHPELKQALADYGDKVRWVYKHFPLPRIHPSAQGLAEASECAAEQGKFWEFADATFDRQDEFQQNDTYDPKFAENLAKELKLNMSKFNSCVSTGKYKSRVQEHATQARNAGGNGTPHTLINGWILQGGAVPYEEIKAAIDQALAR